MIYPLPCVLSTKLLYHEEAKEYIKLGYAKEKFWIKKETSSERAHETMRNANHPPAQSQEAVTHTHTTTTTTTTTKLT